jgi:maltokinase
VGIVKNADLTELPKFLQSRRWFAGKAWPIKHVAIIDFATLDTPKERGRFTVGIVEVTYELGSPERYVLPVTIGADNKFHDALEEDALARSILKLIHEGAQVPSGTGVLRGERFPGVDDVWAKLQGAPSVRRISAEQSNTSVVFSDSVILKIIRKIESGIHPELEVGAFLTKKGFRHAPRLVGALHLTGTAEATVAVAHEFLNAPTDGWAYVLEVFRSAEKPSAAFLEEVRKLGTRVGELHMVLASDTEDPAFAPEPLLPEDFQRWSASIIGEMGVTFAEASKFFPDLDGRRDALTERARKLAHLTPSGSKLRIHGDLHLGQTLRAKEDWALFDFEGEPSRSYVQRRAKYSPLRDVAAMVRSFDYAEGVVERQGAPAAKRAEVCSEAFLKGYFEATKGEKFLPDDSDSVRAVLDVLVLEKLLYELRYELSHRPDWVDIPARALLEGA